MKKTLLIVIILFLITNTLTAQNYEQNTFLQEKLKEIIKEKLKPGNGIESDENNNQELRQGINNTANIETKVAKSVSPESEVHAVINPTDSNNIVLCPIKNSSSGLVLPIYYTKDFGNTWNQSSFNPVPKDINAKVFGGGDPMFTFDGNGRLYFSWIDLYYTKTIYDTSYWGLFWAYSDDGGATWTRPDNDIVGFSTGNYFQQKFDEVYDKQWMATDMSNSAYKNTIYISYLKLQMTLKKEFIVLKKKRPTSDSFDFKDVSISDSTFQDVQFTNMTVDDHGHVHIIFWGSQDKFTYGIWHSVSTNGGNSFSKPNLISIAQKMTHIKGIDDNRIYPCTQFVSDPTNSTLYASWTTTGLDIQNNNGADIYFSKSTDEGLSWNAPMIVNNDDKSGVTKDQFYSSMSVNKKGILAMSWYDGRYSSSNTINNDVRYFMTISNNRGLSFEANFPVTSVPTDFRTVGLKNSSFGIGEYNQILLTNSYAIPVWSDGRINDGNLDIYIAFVKLDSTYTGLHDISVISDKFYLEKIFPNPASERLNIQFYLKESSGMQITIYDMKGKDVKKVNRGTLLQGIHNENINVNDLTPGKYVMLMESDFGNISRTFSIIRNFK
jgi:hypothetical protein